MKPLIAEKQSLKVLFCNVIVNKDTRRFFKFQGKGALLRIISFGLAKLTFQIASYALACLYLATGKGPVVKKYHIGTKIDYEG